MSNYLESHRITHDLVYQFLKNNQYNTTLIEFEKEAKDYINVSKITKSLFQDESKDEGSTQIVPIIELVNEHYLKHSSSLESSEKKILENYKQPPLTKIEEVLALNDIHFNNPLQCAVLSSTPETIEMITTSTDKTIKVTTLQDLDSIPSVASTTTLLNPSSGPIISLDVNPTDSNVVALGSMDHSLSILNLKDESVLSFKDHTKFVNLAKFSPEGNYLFTGSYDHTLNFYKKNVKTNAFVLDHKFTFIGNLESMIVTKDNQFVICAVQQDNYLHYINLSTYQVTRYNMNANQDDFVSFTVVDLQLSPDNKYLLALTDHRSGRLILFETFTSNQVRNYYLNINTDEYSKNICRFVHSGSSFLVSSDDYNIYLVDVDQGTVTHKVQAHQNKIRHLVVTDQDRAISLAFDKSIKVWNMKEVGNV